MDCSLQDNFHRPSTFLMVTKWLRAPWSQGLILFYFFVGVVGRVGGWTIINDIVIDIIGNLFRTRINWIILEQESKMILGQENSWDYKHVNIIHFSILAEMYCTDIFNDLHIKKSLFQCFYFWFFLVTKINILHSWF